jgi:ankyrin repeat protein
VGEKNTPPPPTLNREMIMTRERLRQKAEELIQTRNYDLNEHIDLERFNGYSLFAHRHEVLEKLLLILKGNQTDRVLLQDLIDFLENTWNQSKNKPWCYTVLPEYDLTLFMCELAVWTTRFEAEIYQGKNQINHPLQLLMPGVTAISANRKDYPNLIKLPSEEDIDLRMHLKKMERDDKVAPLPPTPSLEQILKSYIISDDKSFLIPVGLLAHAYSENYDENQLIANPYFCFENHNETNAYLTKNEIKRLINHSLYTKNLEEKRTNCIKRFNESNNLYRLLLSLQRKLRKSSVRVSGSEQIAGEAIFVELVRFTEIYQNIPVSDKEKIPNEVKQFINRLHMLAGDKDTYHRGGQSASVSTCTDTLQVGLLDVLKGNEAELASIPCADIDADPVDSLLVQQAQAEFETSRLGLLSLTKNGAYAGSDSVDFVMDDYGNLIVHQAFMLSVRNNDIESINLFLHLYNIEINSQYSQGLTALMVAVQSGQCDLVSHLLSKNAVPTITDNRGYNLLMLAAEQGQRDMLTFLIEQHNMQIDARNEEGFTPLMLSVIHGQVEAFTNLVNAGADYNLRVQCNQCDSSLLMLAAGHGQNEIINNILSINDINIDEQNNEGMTALMIAAAAGQLDTLNFLLERGASLQITTIQDCTILMVASACNQPAMVKVLIDTHHVEINDQDKNGLTALMMAAINGSVEVIDVLLERNADRKLTDKDDCHALMHAAIQGEAEAITRLIGGIHTFDVNHACDSHALECLFDKGMEVDFENNSKRTALMVAAMAGETQTVKQLISYGADVNKADLGGYTSLMHAIEADENNQAMFDILLNGGSNIEHKDNMGRTPLMIAVQKKKRTLYHKLIELGSDINAIDKNGNSLLMIAIINNQFYAVEHLLTFQFINVNVQNHQGKSALMLAVEKGNIPSVELFLSLAKTDLNIQDKKGQTALLMAVACGNEVIVNKLLDAKAQANIVDKQQNSPLIIATKNSKSEMVHQLLMAKANTGLIDNEGSTALMYAVNIANRNIIRMLLEADEQSSLPLHDCHRVIDIALKNKNHEIVIFLIDHTSHKPSTVLLKECQRAYQHASGLGLKDDVKTLTKIGLEHVYAADEKGLTPLMLAAIGNRFDLVKWLIEGAFPNQGIQQGINYQDPKGLSALMCASMLGHFNIVQYLIENGAKIDATCNDNRTALYYSAMEGHQGVLEFLLNPSSVSKSYDRQKAGALMMASLNGHDAFVERILSMTEGKNLWGRIKKSKLIDEINSRTDPRTSLMVAAEKGHLGVVNILLKHGADANLAESLISGFTALIYAAKKGYAEVVKRLLEYKDIQINHSDKNNMTALMHAANEGHDSIVRLLLSKGAEYKQMNIHKKNVLWFAEENSHAFDLTTEPLTRHATSSRSIIDQLTQHMDTNEVLEQVVTNGLPNSLNSLLKRGLDRNQFFSNKQLSDIEMARLYSPLEVKYSNFFKTHDVNLIHYGQKDVVRLVPRMDNGSLTSITLKNYLETQIDTMFRIIKKQKHKPLRSCIEDLARVIKGKGSCSYRSEQEYLDKMSQMLRDFKALNDECAQELGLPYTETQTTELEVVGYNPDIAPWVPSNTVTPR